MPGNQSDITKFFSPKPKKEKKENEPLNSTKEAKSSPSPKKRKISEGGDATEASIQESAPSCLSPDQKNRMLSNKLTAQIKVASKKMPFVLNENIGPSWFSALQTEFEKPYFAKLNTFLELERKGSVKIFPPHDQVTKGQLPLILSASTPKIQLCRSGAGHIISLWRKPK